MRFEHFFFGELSILRNSFEFSFLSFQLILGTKNKNVMYLFLLFGREAPAFLKYIYWTTTGNLKQLRIGQLAKCHYWRLETTTASINGSLLASESNYGRTAAAFLLDNWNNYGREAAAFLNWATGINKWVFLNWATGINKWVTIGVWKQQQHQ